MDTDNVNKLEEYYIFICYNDCNHNFLYHFHGCSIVIKAAEILLIS